MDLVKSLDISATALAAQRTKVNVISENLANSETTRTADGGPYRRKMVVLKSKDMDFKKTFDQINRDYKGVEVDEVVESQENFRLVHNPAHPDADPFTGYVKMPNVDTLTEMADMIVAKRSYDASVKVIENTKSMIRRALTIGE
ncbi:MAG: flagellar basal body rod protein FlgC [Desulfobacteraceae bacterium]|jgi:flagellar basal-body rod protein FlgC